MDEVSRSHLPHWQPRGAILFLTYRLYGSLPREAYERLAEEKRRFENGLPNPDESRRDRAWRTGKELFAFADVALDSAERNPQWLLRADVAEIVLENLFFRNEKLYRLWAFVIMPNHVHALLEPLGKASNPIFGEEDSAAVAPITHALKSFTAHRANEILNREGAFWEAESYVYWILEANEFTQLVEYIENNPVKAGIVRSPKQWRWSSAAFERAKNGNCTNRIAKCG